MPRLIPLRWYLSIFITGLITAIFGHIGFVILDLSFKLFPSNKMVGFLISIVVLISVLSTNIIFTRKFTKKDDRILAHVMSPVVAYVLWLLIDIYVLSNPTPPI